jgi:HK97 family phage major capsid protein
MASNQHYIEKADLSISNLTNEGGLLVPQQAKEFMEILIEESVILGMATTVPMSAPTFEISKMGFTSRVLRRASESTAVPEADRSKPELGKVQLVTKEFIAEARIPYGVVEDNVANGTFQDYAMRLLAKAVSRDMEEIVISGDTASSDIYLATLDGILKQVTSLTVNANGLRLSKSQMKQAVQTLPSRFLRAQKDLAFLTSKNATIDYIDSLANRQTPLGDEKVVSAAAAEYMGYPVVPIPMFPENLGGSTNQTNMLLCSPKNIHVGIQRDVRVETDRDISAREFIIVATVRFDVKWQHEPATVKVTGILASAGA